MATGLNPRRIHEALCPNHLAKAAHQWPVDGDLKLLFDQCVDCEDVLRNLFAGEDSWWLRLFAGFPVALVEHQAATHEAAHAVVGVVTGHPLERVWIAENGGARVPPSQAAQSTTGRGRCPSKTTWPPSGRAWREAFDGCLIKNWTRLRTGSMWCTDRGTTPFTRMR